MTSEPLVPTPATRAIPAAPTRGPRRVPSITRVFTAAFLAIAVGVLADRYVTWQNARRTQADMVELTHRLERLERMQEHIARLLTALNAPAPSAGGASGGSAGSFGPTLEVLAATTGAAGLALYQPNYDTNEWAATAVRRATAHPLSRDIVRQLVGDAANVLQYTGAAAAPVRAQLLLPESAAPHDRGGLALVPLRSRDRLVGLLVVLLAGDLPGDTQTVLEQAGPNLAIACERESAHQHTRRLAT